MDKKKVVLYPSIGVGHLVPMVELAKQFLRHGVFVSIALTKLMPLGDMVSKLSDANPNIHFHVLPQVDPPSNADPKKAFGNFFEKLRLYNTPLKSFIESESRTSPVSALILDMFCVDALDVAAELGVPAYFFFSCGANALAVFLHLPKFISSSTIGPLKDAGETPLLFPGVPPFPASHLIKEASDPDTEEFKLTIYNFDRLAEGKGILINSFESLEPRAMKALKDGLCLPDRPTPSMYCIGPLASNGEKKEERHPCLDWLDAQPKKSVVFLCFGSMGSFQVEQLKEIAIGLEKSGQRFLWVVRSLPNPDRTMFEPRPEPDLDALLPEGFLDRTKDRGMVVKSWAPQIEVLSHISIGGFVSHCGWNSTLEAMSFRVPMICWPLYAEQKMNKVFLVEDMKIGVELKGYDKELILADELADKVKWIIESEGADELKNRMEEVKYDAVGVLKEGGASYEALAEFLDSLGN
ncbi:hypothetical protein LUZ60_000535 [Juncus effusus]|nr:hypothetical protein LUZ60_000535 [Juncus effusus]